MVFSELAAATMIAICGLKNSYRIILKGERIVRRRIRRPRTIIEGYDSFPRFFIRRVFRAGLVIAMRWEGRAKNAAQIAADARMRARRASSVFATRIDLVRGRAKGVRKSAKESADRVRATAAEVRKRAEDVRTKAQDQAMMIREKATEVKDRAVAVKDHAVAAKDRVVEISRRVQDRISSGADVSEGSRKLSTGATRATKADGLGRRPFHTTGLQQINHSLEEKLRMVRTRFN